MPRKFASAPTGSVVESPWRYDYRHKSIAYNRISPSIEFSLLNSNLPYYNIILWYRFCEFHRIFGAESSYDDRLYLFSDKCFIINMGEESQHSCLVIPHDFHRVVQCVAMSGYTQYTMFFY